MNQGDLLHRLDRIYSAVGAARTSDFNQMKVETKSLFYGNITIRINTEGSLSKSDIEYAAISAIHSLAGFYDYALNYAKNNSIDASEVKSVTANCLALRIARDLSNKDKHPGAPDNTSGVFPKLTDFRRPIRIKWGQGNGSVTFGPSGPVSTDNADADLAIHAVVINSQTGDVVMEGGYVMSLDKILEDGIAAWGKFLTEKGIKS